MLYPGARIITLIPIFFFVTIEEIPAFFFLGIWFVLQFLNGTSVLFLSPNTGGVAWWAHLGGFVAGILLLPFFKKSERRRVTYYPDQYFPW